MSDDPTERVREFVAASRAHDTASQSHEPSAPSPERHQIGGRRARSLVAKALARLRACFEHPSR